MFPLPQFLVFLIITTPAAIVFDRPVVHALVIAAAAVSVATLAVRIQANDAGFLSSVIRAPAFVALVPAFWIFVQILPLNIAGVANPLWDSAGATLARPLSGSISIDPGATLVALAKYLSVVAVTLIAAAVAIDRSRSRRLLFLLATSTTLIAAMVLANGLVPFLSNDAAVGAGTTCAGLGIILAAAAAFHTLERGRARGTEGVPPAMLWLTFTAFLAAAALCSLAVILSATSQTCFAVMCGIATLAAAIIMRRMRFGPWGYSAILLTAVIVAGAVAALWPGNPMLDLTLRFATGDPEPLVAVTQRALAETGWTGTGAGTFAAVLPMYRDVGEPTGPFAPTAAAGIAVEMGRPFLWAMLMAAIAFVVALVHASAQRRRDSFYPIAGASCIVTAALLAFVNDGMLSMPALVIVGATIGMAIAQTRSRSS